MLNIYLSMLSITKFMQNLHRVSNTITVNKQKFITDEQEHTMLYVKLFDSIAFRLYRAILHPLSILRTIRQFSGDRKL